MSENNEDEFSSNDNASLPVVVDFSNVLLTTRNTSTKTVNVDQEKLEECDFELLMLKSPENHNERLSEKLTPIPSLRPNCTCREEDQYSESSAIFEASSFVQRKYCQ